MLEAFSWGLLAASSLLVGGVLSIVFSIGPRLLGVVMAFGAGVLISATAFELVEEAFETSGLLSDVALGLFAGCAAYALGDAAIDRMGGDGAEELEWRAGGGLAPRDRPRHRARRDSRVGRDRADLAEGRRCERGDARGGLHLERPRGRRSHRRARSGRVAAPEHLRPLGDRRARLGRSRRSPATRSSTGPRRASWRSCSPSPAARS